MWQLEPGVPTNILEHKAIPQSFTAQPEPTVSTKAGASGWAVNRISQDANNEPSAYASASTPDQAK